MTKELRKTHRIHIFCAVLVALFLVVIPVTSALSATRANNNAAPDNEAYADPMGRLPSTPTEAHDRLAEANKLDAKTILSQAGLSADSLSAGTVVSIPNNTVYGYTGAASESVTITYMTMGVTPSETTTLTSGTDGFFTYTFQTDTIDTTCSIQVVSGSSTQTINCLLTGTVNVGQNTVTGVAASATDVYVYLRTPSTYYADAPLGFFTKTVQPTAGAYSASFASDLTVRGGDAAYVYKKDSSGNYVTLTANSYSGVTAVQPLVVYPQYDAVLGYADAHTGVEVTADTQSDLMGSAGDGFFEVWFDGLIDIKEGTVVSATTDSARTITVDDVVARCDPSTNHVSGTGPASTTIRLTMNPYESTETSKAMVTTTTDAQGAFDINLTPLDYDSAGSDVYNIAWYDSDGDCVVYEFQTFSWHLAEGYTGGQFDTYVLIQNPNSVAVDAVVTYQVQGGTAPAKTLTVPANSRTTIHLDEQTGLPDASVSTKVTSVTGAPLNAERACYFNYNGMVGGHDSVGVLTPQKTWYLAEGCTWSGYDTWILVQNPGLDPANVTLSFQLGTGTAPDYTFQIPAGSRQSVKLNGLTGLKNGADVSTKVTADQRVVAERAVYFNAGGYNGGSDSAGVDAARKTWYLAEGCTWPGYDEWVLVQNPTTTAADVTLSFQLGTGTASNFQFTLAAGKRRSINLKTLPGLENGADVSTKVRSTVDVVAERAMYFNTNNINGGHAANAAQDASRGWYLPEGYTGGSFTTWVLVQNPGDSAADVKMTFQLGDGTAAPHEFTLPAGKRQSVLLNDLPGLAGKDVSTTVTSDEPVIVERAQYFVYNGFPGGTCATGIPFFVRVPL